MEVEKSIIGSIILDRNAMSEVSDFLKPEMFVDPALKTIYSVCYRMALLSDPIDLVTLTHQLRVDSSLESIGGAYFVTSLTDRLVSVANISFYGRIVQERYLLREVAKIAKLTELLALETDADCFEILEGLDKKIYDLTKDSSTRQVQSINDLYQKQIKAIDNRKEGIISGIMTGLRCVDSVLMGIKPQNLVIIAARPGQGKTAFALSAARNISMGNIPVGFLSMEMSSEELCNRFTALNSSIPLDYLTNQTVKGAYFDRMMEATVQVKNTKLYIDDSPSLSVMQVRNKARKMIIKYGIKLLIVDYLGLMKPEVGKNRTKENEVSEISAGLKSIAKELNIPIIALSQLSRKVEDRPSKEPQLSDLRDSGSIEQDADIVIFLMRPEYYSMNVEVPGETNIYIAKHRNGSTGSVKAKFTPELTKFSDIQTEYQTDYSVYGSDVENKDLF